MDGMNKSEILIFKTLMEKSESMSVWRMKRSG